MVDTGDASVQMMRILLETTQVTFKFAGGVAKETVALIVAAFKKGNEWRKTDKIGENPLKRFLTNNPNSTIFSIPKEQLKDFAKAAKKYGVKYCVVEDKNKGICDVFINSEQAQLVNRIIERYEAARVVADVETGPVELETEIPTVDMQDLNSEISLEDIILNETKTPYEMSENEIEKLIDDLEITEYDPKDENSIEMDNAENPTTAQTAPIANQSERKSEEWRKGTKSDEKKLKSEKRESVKVRLKRAEAKTKAKNVPEAKKLNIEKVK